MWRDAPDSPTRAPCGCLGVFCVFYQRRATLFPQTSTTLDILWHFYGGLTFVKFRLTGRSPLHKVANTSAPQPETFGSYGLSLRADGGRGVCRRCESRCPTHRQVHNKYGPVVSCVRKPLPNGTQQIVGYRTQFKFYPQGRQITRRQGTATGVMTNWRRQLANSTKRRLLRREAPCANK